jgi:hypothetical protein
MRSRDCVSYGFIEGVEAKRFWGKRVEEKRERVSLIFCFAQFERALDLKTTTHERHEIQRGV